MEPGAGTGQTAEQRALRDAVRSLLARHRGQTGDQAAGYDAGLWRRLCREIGVAGLAVPERYGGAGAGPVETHIVAEELGRGLTRTPLLGSAVLAGQPCWPPATTAPASGCCPASPTARRSPRWPGPPGRALGSRPSAACRAPGPRTAGRLALHGEAHYVLDGDTAGCCWSRPGRRTASGCSRWTRHQAGVTRTAR